MADTLLLQTTPATPAAGKIIATFEVASFQGEVNAHVAPTVLTTLSGSEGSWVLTQVSAANPVPISDAAGSLTVDAPVATPVFVRLSDGASPIATLPVSLASAPSTAVTNAGVFVVQENGAALTALQLIDNLPNTQGSTTSGQSGVLVQGAVTTASPSYTNAQTSPLSLDTTGSLRVAIVSGAGSGGTAVADRTGTFTPGSTSFTPIGGYVDDSASDALSEGNPGAVRMTTSRALHVNLATSATGTAIVNGSGTATGALRVELPTNGTGVLATVGTVTTVTTLTGTTTLTPGTGATNLGKAIDAVVGASDVGVATLMRRIDTPATVTPAVADWQELRGDSLGRLYVQTGGGASTGTLANVASSATNVTLLASNTARKGFTIFNDSTSLVYVKAAATATSSSFTWKLLPGESFERMGACYTGIIDGIWASANGNARVTEFT